MIMSTFLVHLIITSLFNNDLPMHGEKINIDKVVTKLVATGLYVCLVIVTGWEISQCFNYWCCIKVQMFILLVSFLRLQKAFALTSTSNELVFFVTVFTVVNK